MKIEGKITSGKISETIEKTDLFTEKNGLKKEKRIQLSVVLEEVLLAYMDKYGSNTDFKLIVQLNNGNLQTKLMVWSKEYNPLGSGSEILERVFSRMDNTPEWSYRSGYNQICITYVIYSTMLKNLQFSWEYMHGQRKYFFIAVISQLIGGALSILAPVLSAKLIVAYTESIFDQIFLIALTIFVVRLIYNFALFLANRSYNIVYNKTLSNLEEALVDSALNITKSSFDENGTGLFIERLTGDTTRLATGFNTLADMSTTLLNYLGILGAVFIISPYVFLVVLALVIMQGILERLRSARVNVLDRIYRQSNERFTGFVSEMVKGSTDVKILNSSETFKAELATRITDANDKRLHMLGRSWVYRLTRMEIGAVAYLGFMVLLAYLIKNGGITSVTAIILFNYYSQLDTSAIAALSEFVEFVRDFNLSAERVYEILQGNHFSKEHFGNTNIEDIRGEVELSHVYFAYKSPDPMSVPRDVLKDMNMLIPPGTTVAFVGLSGSGKSTTINLISKLYDTNKGKVKIDGIDIRELTRETIRSNIAVVSQKPYIFNLSVRDNLRLVKPDMTEEEMISACKKACIHEDILRMEDGYDTVVGEGGAIMSGGQCQRLAIARTLLRDYKILILDEATSALDNITQAKIQEVLKNLHGEKTIIIIAHRLSTTVNADNIFFIDEGKVLASGTHSELLEKCDKYRTLCEGDNS